MKCTNLDPNYESDYFEAGIMLELTEMADPRYRNWYVLREANLSIEGCQDLNFAPESVEKLAI